MAEPWFFLSYSSKDEQPFVDAFYSALRQRVAELTGRSLEDAGYLAGKDIAVGAAWPEDLDRALQTCRTFVPLISPYLLTSDYCGREWVAFQRRLAAATPPGAQRRLLVYPVLWNPLNAVIVPEEVADLQQRTLDQGSEYATYGMKYLFQMDARKDLRAQLIEKIANELIQRGGNPALPPSPIPQPIKELTSTWRSLGTPGGGAPAPASQTGAGPRYAQFVFVAGNAEEIARAPLARARDFYGTGPADWRPYQPDPPDDVVLLTQKVALDQQLRCGDALPLDNTLMTRLQKAEQEKSIVILVIDTWSLQIENCRTLMNSFDGVRLVNCVTLVPWNSKDPATAERKAQLESLVANVFRRTKRDQSPYFIDTIASVDDYQVNLTKALVRLKLELVKDADVLQTAGPPSKQPMLSIGTA